jgi:hypothetical protein
VSREQGSLQEDQPLLAHGKCQLDLPRILLPPTSLVVGGSTIAFPTPGGKITAAPQVGQSIVIVSQTLTTNAQGNIVIAGQTLSSQTSVITISGIPNSLIAGASNATPSLVVDGGTVPIPNTASQAPQTLLLGSQTLTANPDGNFVFGGQTLTPTKGYSQPHRQWQNHHNFLFPHRLP